MTSPQITLPLLRGSTTLEAVLIAEENMAISLTQPKSCQEFFDWIKLHEKDIEATVSQHLGLTPHEICRISDIWEWLDGSFIICIPIYIHNWKLNPGRRVLIRFPLPYKNGENFNPGNIDEKIRCEAATYIWMQDQAPDVPIPYLWGFGCSGGQSV